MKKYTLKKHMDNEQINYLINYKEELNPQQYQAVTNVKGPQLVIAGAGSGKTRTLIYRLAYMVENRINPQSILLLTFTRKSSQEMMQRASNILDARCSRVSGGTFHSFSNYILRKYGNYLEQGMNFNIIDRGDAEDLINMIRGKLNLNKKERRFPKKRTIMDIISKSINKCCGLEEVIVQDYPQFCEDYNDLVKVRDEYIKYKKERKVLDYDDLLVNLRDLLKKNEDIRIELSNMYKYIMIDEYQDTNKIQAEIAALLASEHNNILAVGDDSQSIYSFRGANFRNIMDFPEKFPDTIITTLEQNYRSTRPILKLTNSVIENAKEKYSKELFSDIKGTQKPVFLKTKDQEEQALFISQRVLELREEGKNLHEIAILFRASWHANELEVVLQARNIPYIKYGGLKFSDSAHVKDAMSFLRVIHNVFDEIAWMRVLLQFNGLGPSSASKILAKVLESPGNFDGLIASDFFKKVFFKELEALHSLLTTIVNPNIKPVDQLQLVLEFYLPYFQVQFDDYVRRAKDLDSLLRISERYDDLEKMLTDMVLEPPQGSQNGVLAEGEDDEKLILSTIHSAKGLEWDSVFVMHLVDGYFPSTLAVRSVEEIEEERRLFYVATTRAKRNLYLITPELESRSWSYFDSPGMHFSEPSRFITEIPDFSELAESWSLDLEDLDPF
jgi:DNA helicase-2/ATP-dependent DNA helicase PcrA